MQQMQKSALLQAFVLPILFFLFTASTVNANQNTVPLTQFSIIEGAADGAWVTTSFKHGQGQTLSGSRPDPYGYYTTELPKMNDFNDVAGRVTTDLVAHPLAVGGGIRNSGEAAIWRGDNKIDGRGSRVMTSLGLVYCRDVNNDGSADNSLCGSRALDINNAGVVVGSSHDYGIFGSYPEKPYTYQQGRWFRSHIGSFSGQAYVGDINERGDRVGSGIHNMDRLAHGGVYLQQERRAYAIGKIGEQISYAHAINNHGRVVGQAQFSGAHQAFLWQSDGSRFGLLENLGTLGGIYSVAYDINDDGDVVGYSANTAGEHRAFQWSAATGMVDLGTLNTGDRSVARSINNQGQIVGYSKTSTGSLYRSGAPHAFIYEQGQMHDLNDRLTDNLGWTLVDAYHINEHGEILVRGQRGNENKYLVLTFDGIYKCRDCAPTQDSDGDGIFDLSDAFPYNANESLDTDSDGYGDHRDAYPNDPQQWDRVATELMFSYGRTFGNQHGVKLGADSVTDLHVDVTGNIFQAGSFRQTVDLSGIGANEVTSKTRRDAFVVKTSAEGVYEWHWRSSGFNRAVAKRVVSDAAGNIYVIGGYKYATQFSETNVNGKGWRVFVAKLSTDGEQLWLRTLGGPNQDHGEAIAIDSVGNIYLAIHSDSVTFDADPTVVLDEKTKIGYRDLYITKLSAMGAYLWSYQVGGASSAVYVEDIAVDGEDNLYVGGRFSGAVDFGVGVPDRTAKGDFDGFVLKLSGSAAYAWSWVNAGEGDSQITRLRGATNGVILAGRFDRSADLNPLAGGATHTTLNDGRSYALALSATGVASNIQTLDHEISDLALDGQGNRYIAGQFEGQAVDLDAGVAVAAYTSAGETDAFISKYSPQLSHLWSKQLGGAGVDTLVAMQLRGDHNLYLTGQFSGAIDLDPDQGTNLRQSNGHEDAYFLLLSDTPALLRDSDNDGLSDRIETLAGLDKLDATDVMGDVDGDGLSTFEEYQLGLNPLVLDTDGDGIDDKFELDAIGLDPLSGADSLADNDRDGVSNVDEYRAGSDINVAGVANYAWVYTMGTRHRNSEKINDLHVDSAGYIYQAGEFYGAMDLSSGLGLDQRSQSRRSGFVVKTAPNGGHEWSWVLGARYQSRVMGVSTDHSGNVYVVGEFRGQERLTGQAYYASGYGTTITKLSPEGQVIWGKTIDGAGDDFANDIAVDGDGGIYISGNFSSAVLDVDPGDGVKLLNRRGGQDAYVVKLNRDGDYLWSHQMGGLNSDISIASMVVDSVGQLYVGGSFSGSVDFDIGGGSAIKSSVGHRDDGFVVAVGPVGNYVWSWQMGDTDDDRVIDLAMNGTDLTVLARFGGTVDFDLTGAATPLVAPYRGLAYALVTMDANGGFKSPPRLLPPKRSFYAHSIAYDAAGNLFIGGQFQFAVDFNPSTVVDQHQASGVGAYLTKYYADGFYAWTQSFGGASTSVAQHVAVSAAGDAYVAGYFYATADFDPGEGVDERSSIKAYANSLFLSAFASGDPSEVRDSDGDHLADVVELALGLNPHDASDATADSDQDGVINYQEYAQGSNLFLADTDGDGIGDQFETEEAGLDPLDPTDANLDYDGDGLTNYDEYLRGTDMYAGQTDNFEWAMTNGSNLRATYYEQVNDIATDSAGNSFEVGRYRSSSAFTIETLGGEVVLDNSSSGFLLKRTADGDVAWVVTSGSRSLNMNRVATDADGNSYVAMWYTARNYPRGHYVAKYDAQGNFLWKVKLTTALRNGYNYQGGVSDLIVDPTGFLYFSGWDYGVDYTVVKLSPDGVAQWSRRYPFSVNRLAVDGQGNLYTSGSYTGTQNFDPHGVGDYKTALSGSDIYVSRFLSNGEYDWTWSISERRVPVHLEGLIDGVRLAGVFSHTVDFDPMGVGREVTAPRADAGYVARLGSRGVLVDVRSYNFRSPEGFAIDSKGHTYLMKDGVLAKYFVDGSQAWMQNYARTIDFSHIQLDQNDNVYLSGTFYSSNEAGLDFDPSVGSVMKVSNENSTDMFLMKLNPGDASRMVDSDHDGISDVTELAAGLDYLDASDAAKDFDMDGLSNYQEAVVYGTSVTVSDSDGDGLLDGMEVQLAHIGFDPMDSLDGVADFDGDGVSNADELNVGADPLLASTDEYGWFRVLSSSGRHGVHAMAVDSLNNQIVSISGTVDRSPGTIDMDPGIGESIYKDSALGKFDPEGNLLWAKKMPSDIYHVITDDQNNIYVASRTPNRSFWRTKGHVLTKYDSEGQQLWQKKYGGSWAGGWASINDRSRLALDNSGNVVLYGTYRESMNFGGNVGPDPKGHQLFFVRLDRDGNYMQHWVSCDEVNYASAYPGGLTIDSANNIYLSGVFRGDIQFDSVGSSDATYSRTSYSGFLVKLALSVDAAGLSTVAHQWSRVVDDINSNQSYPYAVALDEHRNKIHMLGNFAAEVDFNPGSSGGELVPRGRDVFVAQYDLEGNYLDAMSLGGTGTDHNADLTIDGAGNLYLLTQIDARGNVIDLDPTVGVDHHAGIGGQDIALTKLSSTGVYQWSQLLGGPRLDRAVDLTMDSAGQLYLLGTFEGQADLDINLDRGEVTAVGETAFYRMYTPLALQ